MATKPHAPLRRIVTPAFQTLSQQWEVLECGHRIGKPWVQSRGSYKPRKRRRCLFCLYHLPIQLPE
jgi:hypothetical protein